MSDTHNSTDDHSEVQFIKRKVKKGNTRKQIEIDDTTTPSTPDVDVSTLELLTRAKRFEESSSRSGIDLDTINTLHHASIASKQSTKSTPQEFHEFKASDSLAKIEAEKEEFIREELRKRQGGITGDYNIDKDGKQGSSTQQPRGTAHTTTSLYKQIAEHLPKPHEKESNHWTGGVMEVNLPISARLENLERTEKATEEWMKRKLHELQNKESSVSSLVPSRITSTGFEDGSSLHHRKVKLEDTYNDSSRQRSRDYKPSLQTTSPTPNYSELSEPIPPDESVKQSKTDEYSDYRVQQQMARIISSAQTRRDNKVMKEFVQRGKRP